MNKYESAHQQHMEMVARRMAKHLIAGKKEETIKSYLCKDCGWDETEAAQIIRRAKAIKASGLK